MANKPVVVTYSEEELAEYDELVWRGEGFVTRSDAVRAATRKQMREAKEGNEIEKELLREDQGGD